MNIKSFFLNDSPDAKENQVVAAPAFSLTKVMASAAVIVAPIATVIVDNVTKAHFSAGNYVVLATALLGFLAITAAADVLGRSFATGAASRAKAADAALASLLPFAAPLSGSHIRSGADDKVKVLAAAKGDVPYFLVQDGPSLKWFPADEIKIG